MRQLSQSPAPSAETRKSRPHDGAPGHSSLRDALATITSLDSSALNAPGLWDTAREARGWAPPLQTLCILGGVGAQPPEVNSTWKGPQP